jgi:hypothetical protein
MDHDEKMSYLLHLNKEHVQIFQDRKDRKKEYDKQRYERLHGYKDKDDSIECDVCGGYYTSTHRWQHIGTKKHQKAYSKHISENVKH